MLQINGKTFMNLQEAVQWLLDNNALPFQSSANYVANTEIGLGTIVNPSPAKVRIGSLIFFADSKVSTVTGLTENGFIVSDQYNDLVDDVVYVSNVALNASGHLIVTLSNGTDIDAGLVKQISSFSINGSQHLIANYNDGSSSDLGAIFNGNIVISGDLTISGQVQGNITATGYIKQKTANQTVSATITFNAGYSTENIETGTGYCVAEEINGVLYLIANLKFKNNSGVSKNIQSIGSDHAVQIDYDLPQSIGEHIYDYDGNALQDSPQYSRITVDEVKGFVSLTNVEQVPVLLLKGNGTYRVYFDGQMPNLTLSAGETAFCSIRCALTLI